MCMAMLLQREPQAERISVDTLRHIATVGPAYLREASATLSRILASSGIIDEGFDHRVSERRRPTREYNAVADVPAEWLSCVSDGDPPRCSVPQALRHAGMYCLSVAAGWQILTR